ncbi:MAG: succinylglutamate desuccinylase/aspartoacylase family protein [Gammaproteobacteria bacterium]|nr:succinylglutamate desuccinylase/aspartoacylase family protein [Gammaproteobacteria bacterium]
MLETLVSIELPVGEHYYLKRHRFTPVDVSADNGKRISIISGTHGDELEGIYVISLLAEWLKANPSLITGTIDLYPSLNSLGIDSITRTVPFYQTDLNRIFPGTAKDTFPNQIAAGIVEAIQGSDIAIDIHASNIFLRELPQVRIASTYRDSLVPLAKQLNMDFIWVHDAITVLEATLAHSLNQLGTHTLVVEYGVGMRLTPTYGEQLLDGLFNLMAEQGILAIAPRSVRVPFYSDQGEVYYVNSPAAGLFVPAMDHCQMVVKDQLIGHIHDPYGVESPVPCYTPGAGVLFTLREYPIVYEGSLLARIFDDQKGVCV